MHTATTRGIDALVLLMDYPYSPIPPGILIAYLTRAVRTAVVKK